MFWTYWDVTFTLVLGGECDIKDEQNRATGWEGKSDKVVKLFLPHLSESVSVRIVLLLGYSQGVVP